MPRDVLTGHSPLRPVPEGLAAWVDRFQREEIPVLGSTADALQALRANEDDVDARAIGELTSADPLMTLRVLVYAAGHRSAGQTSDVQSVTDAVMLMGTSRFFSQFSDPICVEDRLSDQTDVLLALQGVIRRSHRAARFALGFAVHRNDHDAALVYQAALLHDFAEMLLHCHAPEVACKIAELQAHDPTLRSRTAQQQVLGCDLQSMQHKLMVAWQLPALLTRIADDRDVRHPSALSVALAIRIARHSAESWANPALPDDVTAVSALLNLSEAAVDDLLHEIDS